MRELANGELLVGVKGDMATVNASLWLSSGWASGAGTPTWSKVKDLSSPDVYVDQRFSGSECVHGADVFVAEYGSKVVNRNARFAYLSRDNGATWSTLYTGDNANGYHLHGIAYDAVWDRVWLSHGDDTQGLLYSDDWASGSPTWTTVFTDKQPVGIIPMTDRILLLSDDLPNGVWHIPRTGYRAMGALDTSTYHVNESALLTHVPSHYRRSTAGTVFIAFAPITDSGETSILLATTDGISFTEIWRDPQGAYSSAYSHGLFIAVGPTAQNNIIGDLLDDRFTYTVLKVALPV